MEEETEIHSHSHTERNLFFKNKPFPVLLAFKFLHKSSQTDTRVVFEVEELKWAFLACVVFGMLKKYEDMISFGILFCIVLSTIPLYIPLFKYVQTFF